MNKVELFYKGLENLSEKHIDFLKSMPPTIDGSNKKLEDFCVFNEYNGPFDFKYINAKELTTDIVNDINKLLILVISSD